MEAKRDYEIAWSYEQCIAQTLREPPASGCAPFADARQRIFDRGVARQTGRIMSGTTIPGTPRGVLPGTPPGSPPNFILPRSAIHGAP
eukprot:5193382-Amphidinium_carterae.1